MWRVMGICIQYVPLYNNDNMCRSKVWFENERNKKKYRNDHSLIINEWNVEEEKGKKKSICER